MRSNITGLDKQYMQRAIQLAKQGLYTTRTNPRVGCLIVKDKVVVGEGWHYRPGENHAEINALNQAGVSAKGADCYVTLEPCFHTGKTLPCIDALLDVGIARLIYGQEDPNPQVGGQSIDKLRGLGIEVIGPLLDQQCRQLNLGFNKRMSIGLPWVSVKLAMSIDGRTAMANGQSFWITGPKARRDVQLLRAQSCAVISSWSTVKCDEASLTLRPKEFDLTNELQGVEQPIRVLVDSQCRADFGAPFFKASGNIIIASAMPSDRKLPDNVKQLICPDNQQMQVDLTLLLQQLAKLGINQVLVESGSTLSGAFIRQGLVDELWVYMAPKLMGSNAKALLELPLEVMAEALPMRIEQVDLIGRDLKILFLPEKE